jgi:hypothetical protein
MGGAAGQTPHAAGHEQLAPCMEPAGHWSLLCDADVATDKSSRAQTWPPWAASHRCRHGASQVHPEYCVERRDLIHTSQQTYFEVSGEQCIKPVCSCDSWIPHHATRRAQGCCRHCSANSISRSIVRPVWCVSASHGQCMCGLIFFLDSISCHSHPTSIGVSSDGLGKTVATRLLPNEDLGALLEMQFTRTDDSDSILRYIKLQVAYLKEEMEPPVQLPAASTQLAQPEPGAAAAKTAGDTMAGNSSPARSSIWKLAVTSVASKAAGPEAATTLSCPNATAGAVASSVNQPHANAMTVAAHRARIGQHSTSFVQDVATTHGPPPNAGGLCSALARDAWEPLDGNASSACVGTSIGVLADSAPSAQGRRDAARQARHTVHTNAAFLQRCEQVWPMLNYTPADAQCNALCAGHQ